MTWATTEQAEEDTVGLFQHRPEEPTEWAGLPSEPARIESDAQRLREPAPVDPSTVDLTAGATSVRIEISVPVEPSTGPGD